jgi:hypothetical protein
MAEVAKSHLLLLLNPKLASKTNSDSDHVLNRMEKNVLLAKCYSVQLPAVPLVKRDSHKKSCSRTGRPNWADLFSFGRLFTFLNKLHKLPE